MRKNILIACLLILSFNSYLVAQKKVVLPSDSVKFVKSLERYMSKTKDKSKVKKVMKPFSKLWNDETFSHQKRLNVYKQTNAIIKRRGRAYPHIELYLKTIMAIEEHAVSSENYELWCDYFSLFLEQRKFSTHKLKRMLENSYHLFSENAIYKNTMMSWKLDQADYVFSLENEQLKVSFKDCDLKCFSKKDSITIHNTGGYYFFNQLNFTGSKGWVLWERLGLPKETISAKLNHYNLNLKKTNFSIDTVEFINTNFFQKPILGSLYHKVTKIRKKENSSYPQFKSFTDRFEIKNIFPKVDYSGGFFMKGAKFLGAGSKQTPARLLFHYKDTLTLEANSRLFIFQKKQIVSPNTVVKIYLDQDSIYHPGLLFTFDIPNEKIDLQRNKKGVGRSPYSNTYHNLDMKIARISWNMKKPKLELYTDINQSYGYLESFNYYSEDDYMDLQKTDFENPLLTIKHFVKANGGGTSFYADEFANFMRMSMPQTHKFLLNLALKGYLSYDLDIDHIVVKKKLFHYLTSSVGRKDYDIITFFSNKVDKNGEISLLSKKMKMNGVYKIFLSDSQDVVVYPRNGNVIIDKDRDFSFDGRVDAGLFTFYGKNYHFSYKNFKIKLNNVERLQMYIRDPNRLDEKGNPRLLAVKTNLSNLKGDLLIDKPFNKSGVKKSPEYPIFNSEKESYAYYEHPNIQNGAYDKSRFYFQVYPYTFDSLDTYEPRDLRFKGYFNSADILPGFEGEIGLRPDLSLGLYREFKQDEPLYKGKGQFKGIIDLSNKGLLAEGSFDYLQSTTHSSDIVMLPDALRAKAEQFVNDQTDGVVEYPLVEGTASLVNWYPYQDNLTNQTQEKPLKIYDNKTSLEGLISLRPNGMKGAGKVDLTTAEMTSKEYVFKAHTFDADTVKFNLKSKTSNNVDFITDNVNAHIDYTERKGEFKSNGEASFVNFPANQYICYMDQFAWYMDEESVEISSSGKAIKKVIDNDDLGPLEEDNVELSGPQFVSIHPKQDSLNFVSLQALYNNKTKKITAQKVASIRVADAIIYPSDSTIVIGEEAYMHPLKESKILANTVTKYHTIKDASVKIKGRKSYFASGAYEYVMRNGKKENIFFESISVDSTMQTVGKGNIKLTDDFTLSSNFAYNGKVNLYANQEFLNFKGYAKMQHDCERTPMSWFNFESEINPKEILIPIQAPLHNMNDQKLHSSFMIANDSNQVYPAFLSPHKKYSDVEMLPTEGYLMFDSLENKYVISNKDKLEETSLPGNYLSIHKSICNVFGEGKINIGADFGRFEIESAGEIHQNTQGSSTILNVMMFLKFHFNNKCLNIMAKDLEKSTEGVEWSDAYFKGITELVGREKAEPYINNVSLGSRKKYPKKLLKGILLSEINLSWDKATHSFNSKGLIGIGNILNKQVDKSVYGRIQIVKRRRGNHFYMYLEVDADNWYFFHMSNNVLKTCSSNKEYNTIIKELKSNDRRLKSEKGLKPYSYFLAPEVMKNKFLKQFEKEEDNEDEDKNVEKNTEEEHF